MVPSTFKSFVWDMEKWVGNLALNDGCGREETGTCSYFIIVRTDRSKSSRNWRGKVERQKWNANSYRRIGQDTVHTCISSDSIDVAYENYAKFDKYHREEGQDLSSFIIEFQRRHDLCKKSDMSLPNDVLSFKLLNSAGLSEADRQLALILAKDLKFLLIKSALKQIFIRSSHSDSFVGGGHTRVK